MKISKFFSNNSDYGFMNNIDNYTIKSAKHLSFELSDWDITSLHSEAKNHCAAVTSTNIDKYFSEIFKIYENFDIISRFNQNYNFIGNGPIFSFANKTKIILAKKNININYKRKWINKLSFIKDSIDKDNIVALLLCSNFKDYHWIICTGYFITSDDKIILKIIDNWNKSYRYYIPSEQSFILKVTSFGEFKISF